MKSVFVHGLEESWQSPPSRGAWIEILMVNEWTDQNVMSPPSRGAWIEIFPFVSQKTISRGRPPRGGRGLKFRLLILIKNFVIVAPLAGGVD